MAADIRSWLVTVKTLRLCNPLIIDTFRTKDAAKTVNMPATVNLMKINVKSDVCACAVLWSVGKYVCWIFSMGICACASISLFGYLHLWNQVCLCASHMKMLEHACLLVLWGLALRIAFSSWPKCLAVLSLQCSVLLSHRQQFMSRAPYIGAFQRQAPWDAVHLKQAVAAH